MRITKRRLRKIILEENAKLMAEAEGKDWRKKRMAAHDANKASGATDEYYGKDKKDDKKKKLDEAEGPYPFQRAEFFVTVQVADPESEFQDVDDMEQKLQSYMQGFSRTLGQEAEVDVGLDRTD